MRSRRALLAVLGGLACHYSNPAYDPSSSSDGPGTSTTGEGPGTGQEVTGPGDSTQGPASSTGPVADSTTGEPSGDTTTGTEGPPPGCDAQEPQSGLVCHTDVPLPLPPACTTPRLVHVANLDSDDFDDVLVVCEDEGGLMVMFPGQQTGIGPWEIVGEAGAAPRDIAVEQLDGQGEVDIVVINEVPSYGVRVFFRDETGMASPPMDFDPGANPTSVAVGYWTEQKHPDLLVTLVDSNAVAVLNYDGVSAYTGGIAVPTNDHSTDIALGQFDSNDNDRVDLAVINQASRTLRVFLNMGMGMTAPDPSYLFTENLGAYPVRLLLNDVEPDDDLDILYARGGGGALRVFRGDNSGNFAPEVGIAGEELVDLDDGDFDENGLPDAVLADYDGQSIIFALLLDNSGATDYMERPIGGRPRSIAAGYIDGDERSDVAVVLEEPNELVLVQSLP